MEYRRLQMSKGGSFLLSLPKEWALKRGLKSGDILRLVEEESGVLTIRAEGTPESERGASVVINELEGMERQIRTNYLYGTDTITIDLGVRMTQDVRDQVKTAIHKLIGLEIVEEEANSMTVQCLLQPTSMPIKSTLKRAYTIAASMHKEAEQALAHGDVELAEAVSKRDDEVDRLYFLMVRELRLALRRPEVAEKLGVGPSECLDLRMAAKYVETIADYSGIVAGFVPKIQVTEVDEEIMDALTELSGISYTIHQDAAQALFRQDSKLAAKVMLKNASLGQELVKVNEMLMSKQPRIAALLDSVAMYFYQIGSHGIDLAELVSAIKVQENR
jgi:phosphate uptake regulator